MMPFGRSVCTRVHSSGPREITAEELAQYLADDHLCPDCAGTPDSVYSQNGVAAQRQSTVPEVQG